MGFLALVLLLATAFVGLSYWQLNRAQHKNDALSSQDIETVKDFNDVVAAQVPQPGLVADQRVMLTGHYLPDAQVAVTGRYHDGTEGFWVVTMFVPDDARLGEAAELPAAAEADGTRPIAIPVVRGWVESEEAAMSSRAHDGPVEMTARLGPIEGPESTEGLPAGQVRTVSTSQLVNLFDIYTYSGYLFPEQDTGPGASAAVDGLTRVHLTADESGGFDLQSGVYALEWLFFAGFAFYIWWRLLRDAHLAQQRAAAGKTVDYVVVKPAGAKGTGQVAQPQQHPMKDTDGH
ncbi:oxidoreductase [Brevibacterium luteolum]|uniref:SURF1-like protein n=2 Tax=Brevibacterium luteolum TaxID=199591 RepID=A0A2N6PI57_9MICO|nr:oxidoreductase [Brevibacterium luteolum]